MRSALSSRRSWVARIAVLAMVASLMAFGAAPASAAIDTSSSCPSSIPDAGFTDLAGVPAAAVDAINCIADYGISTGTTATTFAPFGTVERWQMALFITRQITAHGLGSALPAGTDQGFTDLAGVPAAAVTAINQIAELGISTGTSATTFDPFGTVERWQMALFLARLIDIAIDDNSTTDDDANNMPDGSDQGFTDLTGVPAAAVTAINQIAQLDVADGTTATTFAPFADVERWQMALFLARTLAADGIVPTGAAQVVITPTADATLSQGQAKTFTIQYFNADGSAYTGLVGVQVHDVNASDAIIYNDAADNVVLEAVDASTPGTATFSTFPGLDGSLTVVIRHAGATEKVRVLGYLDSDGDGTADGVTSATTPPTEPYAVSGLVTFDVPPAEAADNAGTYAGYVVTGVGTSSFTASNAAGNCGNGVGAECTFNWDADDIFRVLGSASTQANFIAELNTGDTVSISAYDDAQPSATTTVDFNITTNVAATTALKVTVPASATSVDAGSYVVQGTGNAGAVIKVYTDANNNGAIDGTDAAVAQTTVTASGSWAVSVPLAQGTTTTPKANDFTVTQKIGTDPESAPVDVPTITEPAAPPVLQASQWYDDAAASGLMDVGDVIDLNFNEAMAAPGSGDAVEIFDGDGTRVRLTCGTNATCTQSTNDQTIRFTVTLFPEVVTAGTTAGLASPAQTSTLTGFLGTDGNAPTGAVILTEAAGPAPALP